MLKYIIIHYNLLKFKFIGTISHMAKDDRLIWIPKRYHKDIVKLQDIQVRITIDDEI